MRFLAFALACLLPVAAVAQPVPSSALPPDFSLPGPAPTGRFFGSFTTSAPSSNALAASNTLYATPVYIRAGSVLQTLGFNITAGNASAWNARLCLYADSGAGLPGALAVDAGTVAVGSGSVTGVQTATISGGLQLAGGWYWLAFNGSATGESLSSLGNGAVGPSSSSKLLGWAAAADITGSTTATGVSKSLTFGACPVSYGTPTYADGGALPYVIMGF